MKCFFVELVGEPRITPEDNITEYRWIDKDYAKEGITVAPLLSQQVIPALVKKGFL